MEEMKIDVSKVVDGAIEKIKQEGFTVQNCVLIFGRKWIPCSERLPDSKEDVLVWFEYFRYGEYDCLYQTYGIGNYIKKNDDWMVNHETGWDQLRVIAWMPLPEPPKEDENE